MKFVDILYDAHRIAGILTGPQRGLSQSEIADGMAICNAMLDSWNIERLFVYSITPSTFAISANTQSYTIGDGLTWDTPRPPKIEMANFKYNSAGAQPIEVPMTILTDQQWAARAVKNVTSTISTELWYDENFPTARVWLYPIPQVGEAVILWLWSQFTAFTDQEATVSFPPGYLEAIQYNLAFRLIPRYRARTNLTVTDIRMVEQLAIDAIAKVKRNNVPMLDLSCDAALVNRKMGGYDWRTGDYRRGGY